MLTSKYYYYVYFFSGDSEIVECANRINDLINTLIDRCQALLIFLGGGRIKINGIKELIPKNVSELVLPPWTVDSHCIPMFRRMVADYGHKIAL